MTLLSRHLPPAPALTPRPYQDEALDALDMHLGAKPTNPCVVIPTGGGKSALIAWAIQRWKLAYPPLRVCVLAHRKELVSQNSRELAEFWPTADIGIFCAALRQRDYDASILYASIDTIHNKWGDLKPFDVIIVDEAHRIPARGEGKYRSFIAGCQTFNADLRVVGFTATPYRLGMGSICHRDHLLHEVCYDANVADLIGAGFLCRLRSRISASQPDIANVRRNGRGDYIEDSLSEAVDVPEVVQAAVAEIVTIMRAENRKSAIVFCVDMAHCEHVSLEFRKYGIDAPYVTAKTTVARRDQLAAGFVAGRYKVLLNINVYTEGFNAKRVDCIALLRPTLSRGLYVQMVGRGLRLHPDKTDCLILDFAHCIEEHGPIDLPDDGDTRVIKCEDCGDVFSRAIRVCPHCGWEIPAKEVERAEAEERKRKLHERQASKASILSGEPEEYDVDDVTCHVHRKSGMPDSIRVEYRCNMTVFSEWVCLDHDGFAGQKARAWWARRFGREEAAKVTVASAMQDMLLNERIKDVTATITVQREGKLTNVIRHRLRMKEESMR